MNTAMTPETTTHGTTPGVSLRDTVALLSAGAGLASILATLLTHVEFPAQYWRLAALEPGPAAILLARNTLLFIGALLAIVALTRVAAGSPPPSDAPVTEGSLTSTS